MPKALGAGLLLQPIGLAVLSRLGLDKTVIEGGSIIRELRGKVAGSKWLTLHVTYKDYAAHLFGIGAHRGRLFSALYDKAIEIGVNIRPSLEIMGVEQQNGKAQLIAQDGVKYGPYDLVVDASGQKSMLRKKYADVKLDRPYPYGAIWSIVKIQDNTFRLDTLEQRYKHACHMIGVLPVGHSQGEAATEAAFFWSLKTADYARWREQDLGQWKNDVIALWPETANLLQQFQTHDDLTLATYSDIILRKYHSGIIVFIGDAAHCTSPQLGQGANLALVDALVLSECVEQENSISAALARYTGERKKHLWFYQTASRMLTPLFQSDSLLFPKLRFLLCGLGCKIPFTRRIAAQVLTGTKTGLFTTLPFKDSIN